MYQDTMVAAKVFIFHDFTERKELSFFILTLYSAVVIRTVKYSCEMICFWGFYLRMHIASLEMI